MLQTRSGKRTTGAAIRIAVEMEKEGLIDKAEAVCRVEPAALDQLLTNSAAAGRKFTHAYYWPPHYPAYFDAQCSKVQHGTPYPPSDSNHKSP